MGNGQGVSISWDTRMEIMGRVCLGDLAVEYGLIRPRFIHDILWDSRSGG